MHIHDFSVYNRRRCESVKGFNHALHSWSLSDWFTATLGELGEAANIAKKLNRVRDGIPGNGDISESELKEMLAMELADVYIYLDLLMQAVGVNPEDMVLTKFNITSEKVGYPCRLSY